METTGNCCVQFVNEKYGTVPAFISLVVMVQINTRGHNKTKDCWVLEVGLCDSLSLTAGLEMHSHSSPKLPDM